MAEDREQKAKAGKPQKWVGVQVLESAQPMTAAEAKESQLVKEDYEGEESGYMITEADGSVSWLPDSIFMSRYRALTEKGEQQLAKFENPVAELAQALKVRELITKVEEKKYSLKELALQVLNVYGVKLEEINN